MNTIWRKVGVALVGLVIPLVGCKEEAPEEQTVAYLKVVNVPEGTVSLTEGDVWQMKVEPLPETASDASAYTYRYTSNNEAVCTVDDEGSVTAVKEGEAVITAWALNNADLWASCIVTVDRKIYPVTSIDIPDAYKDYYMQVGAELDVATLITLQPQNATEQDVVYMTSDADIVSVNSKGELTALTLGDAVITVKATDGSGVTGLMNVHVRTPQYNYFDRTDWTVSTSHPYYWDAVIGGMPESLIDGDPGKETCLALVKPGKSVTDKNPTGAVKHTVGADESVFFVVDMKREQEFDCFQFQHRKQNTYANLRVKEIAVYGSHDGEIFEEIVSSLPIDTKTSILEIMLPKLYTYRYFKVQYTQWNSGGNTIQVSELNIGKVSYSESIE